MAQKRIEIITDSTCDIPPALLEQYQITVLSHMIIWGENQYRDRVDLSPEAFYRRLTEEKELPTTAQVSVLDFEMAFERARERGAEAVVAVLINSHYSGAIQSARKAAESAKIPVHIYDTLEVTMGLGWQVLAAARAREAGGDVADILAAVEEMRRRVKLYISLDTLEYLYRGGRIGNAKRLVGAMLNIKPLVYVDAATGMTESFGVAMTRHKGIDQLYQHFFEQLDTQRPMHLAVLHGGAPEDAAELCARIQAQYHPAELLTNITCPILGLNTGPKALALSGYSE